MGATPHSGGVGFRVWAPHATGVSVIGSFNNWDGAKNPLQAEENGNWYADVPGAKIGDPYKYLPARYRKRGVDAHRPLCPRGDRFDRQRGGPRSGL
ncbi:hypothetical protein [Geomonas subterranea]|nr:hypothetical protein [Geomonas fuzhouensis]